MKVRFGIGSAGHGLDPAELEALCSTLVSHGFDSIWISEVLSQPGLDPLVALGWLAGRLPTLKIGTTFLIPGRNVLRLARQLATLDHVSGGRLLVTGVPGIAHGAERFAVGVAPRDRGAALDAALPVLASLLRGDPTDVEGPTGVANGVVLDPLPVQHPLEIWLGGSVPAALERCGRFGDGWLPAMITPLEARRGKETIDLAAERAGRRIDPEHFGVSIGYSFAPLPAAVDAALRARARRDDVDEIVPIGPDALRELLASYIDGGFSKFVLRPLLSPTSWSAELEMLAGTVLELQT